MSKPLKITFIRWARLQAGNLASVHHDRARLGYRNGAFVMEGPSGTHTLQADATDYKRLDAHWQIFASNSANQYGA
jgi:hypothetical protein